VKERTIVVLDTIRKRDGFSMDDFFVQVMTNVVFIVSHTAGDGSRTNCPGLVPPDVIISVAADGDAGWGYLCCTDLPGETRSRPPIFLLSLRVRIICACVVDSICEDGI